MERKVPFEIGENYHAYTRGVNKQSIFDSDQDKYRFMLLLLLCNSKEKVHLSNLLYQYKGEPLIKIFQNEVPRERLVHIFAYCLMGNHFHLILQEIENGGISRFMLKLMTAYSMYFNTKFERSGPLFVRPFRSSHIDSQEYLRWVFSYVHLNPVEQFVPDWKENGEIQDEKAVSNFIRSYTFSSFYDYSIGERPERSILAYDFAPDFLKQENDLEDLLAWQS